MSKISFKCEPNLFRVGHMKYATDRHVWGYTIVKAFSKQEAVDTLNKHLSGDIYDKTCDSIDNVYELEVLTKE